MESWSGQGSLCPAAPIGCRVRQYGALMGLTGQSLGWAQIPALPRAWRPAPTMPPHPFAVCSGTPGPGPNQGPFASAPTESREQKYFSPLVHDLDGLALFVPNE